MSPEAKRNFEAEWAVLSRRLRLLLARKRVSPAQHDDLLQETALRLVSMWDSVDRRRELWPLTVTIALNLLRDRGRVSSKDDLVSDMPEMRSLTDVETAGIARMELSRVRAAMDQLSESHRSILMKEIGGHTGAALPDGAADKMLRMRARRKLRSALGKVSGLVALRVRRVGELFESLVVLRDGGVSAASCAFCLALGVGSVLVPPAGVIPDASAGQVRGGSHANAIVATARSASVATRSIALRIAIAEARTSGAGAPLVEEHDATSGVTRTRRAKGAEKEPADAGSDDLIGPLPLGGGDDDMQEKPSISVQPASDGPALPTDDGGDAPSPPPVPDPPPAPAPPGDDGDTAADPVGKVTKVTDTLL